MIWKLSEYAELTKGKQLILSAEEPMHVTREEQNYVSAKRDGQTKVRNNEETAGPEEVVGMNAMEIGNVIMHDEYKTMMNKCKNKKNDNAKKHNGMVWNETKKDGQNVK